MTEGPDAERVIRKLATDGNGLIFTTSFGFMNPTIKVAKQFPNVKFEHATGYRRAATSRPTTPASTRAARSSAPSPARCRKSGVVGYIGSFPIPEVVMGINAFTLAAQKVNPTSRPRSCGSTPGTIRARKATPPRR